MLSKWKYFKPTFRDSRNTAGLMTSTAVCDDVNGQSLMDTWIIIIIIINIFVKRHRQSYRLRLNCSLVKERTPYGGDDNSYHRQIIKTVLHDSIYHSSSSSSITGFFHSSIENLLFHRASHQLTVSTRRLI